MNEGALDTSDYIRVNNNCGVDFIGMYAGVEYLFRDGGFTDVPGIAAAHIFGIGLTDKTRVVNRTGWQNEIGFEAALDRLSKFTFTDVPLAPATTPVSPKAGRAKASKPTPLVNAGVEAGEAAPNAVSPSEASEVVGDL